MKVRAHFWLRVNSCVSQIGCINNTYFLHLPVFESRRHSQCSHICPQCPSSCPGTSLPLFFFLFFFYLTRFLKAYQRGILLVSVLIVFIVSSDWRCADEASRAGVIAVKREAAGGADRRQPWWLLSDLCWARGGGGRGNTNQLQLCWIYRDVVKEGWSLKEAVRGNERHGLCKPLRKILLNAATWYLWIVEPSPQWADSKLQ